MYVKIDEVPAYRMAMELGREIWDTTKTWDYFARDTVAKQLVRCADSIAANIAEGHGRHHRKDRRLFLNYARGSALETWCFLAKCEERKLMQPDRVVALRSLITKIGFEINKQRKALDQLKE